MWPFLTPSAKDLNDLALAMSAPALAWADATKKMCEVAGTSANAAAQAIRDPNNPFAHTAWGQATASYFDILEQGSKAGAASAELFGRLPRRYPKQPFAIAPAQIGKCTVPIVEETVTLTPATPFCRLVRFRRDVDNMTGPASEIADTRQRVAKQHKIFLAAPLSGHYATLLRGTIAEMARYAEVYVTDWACASTVPASAGPFTFDDYARLMRQIITTIGPGTHVMAVCQPCVAVLAAIALMNADKDPAAPPSLTLMGGPIDTRVNPQGPNKVADMFSLEQFRAGMVHRVGPSHVGFGREVCPGFLQLTGFVLPNFGQHASEHLQYWLNLQKGASAAVEKFRRFYDEYNAVMDMPGEYYLQTIDYVFKRHLLPKGELVVDGRRVDLGAIDKTAVMTVEGEEDDITGPGQTKAVHGLLTHPDLPAAMKRHHEEPGAGHFGIFNGHRWREHIAPAVNDFQTQHAI